MKLMEQIYSMSEESVIMKKWFSLSIFSYNGKIMQETIIERDFLPVVLFLSAESFVFIVEFFHCRSASMWSGKRGRNAMVFSKAFLMHSNTRNHFSSRSSHSIFLLRTRILTTWVGFYQCSCFSLDYQEALHPKCFLKSGTWCFAQQRKMSWLW